MSGSNRRISTGWSRPWFKPKGEWKGRGYLSPASLELVRQYAEQNPNATRKGLGPAFEGPDVADNAYADGVTAEQAIHELNRLKDQPFFMAVGFEKPHLPFSAPKKYWDMYDADTIKLSGNWRYTEWIDQKTGEVKDRELYDHESGPLAARNQIADSALADTVSELSRLLDKGQGWKAFLNRR